MLTIHTVAELRAHLRAAPAAPIFVPTMGNLHEGHLALIQQAKAIAADTGAPVSPEMARACAIRARCPSCRLPMVGTKMGAAGAAPTSARSSAMVWITRMNRSLQSQ